jgi:hypothetical protein
LVDEAARSGCGSTKKAVQRLMVSTRGTVLRAGQDGYDTTRAVWNGMIDRSPA